MSLYLWINILAISVPLIASFDHRIQLHKKWKFVIPAIFISMVPYIIWDVIFTHHGFWGFNPEYLQGIDLINLPLEEWLFFIAIPYACIFTHYTLTKLNPGLKLGMEAVKAITVVLLVEFVVLAIIYYDNWYTLIDVIFAFIILGATYKWAAPLLQSYYLTFLVILIPFFIVNGVLTGTGITDEVVWYNEAEFIGIRLGTIPAEDTIYAFSMILLNLLLVEVMGWRKS
ncbi:lycopene cyclase domain-containing protein [bacterium SCSIO 12643]|nr:lycopene cyclase domain-containing protein [bacterium SCSIO 12643]